jgi:hypothetical protein
VAGGADDLSKKPTGLAAFTSKPMAETAVAAEDKAPGAKKKRGEGDTVALTVRLSKADWMRLHQLAMTEGVSLQTLALTGFSKVLADHGLDPITS